MNLSLRKYLLFLNVAVLLLFSSALRAQNSSTLLSSFPAEGESVKYSSFIQFPKAYISGICILKNEEENITGSIFNEFGVSFLSFIYNKEKDKVKLVSLTKPLDKWYIRMTLRNDLKAVVSTLRNGGYQYENNRRNIIYRFEPLKEETPQTEEDDCGCGQ